ncbi:glutamine synthetase family protein [Arthrobacter sp. ISL-28]|uniref:glutamine synthetase family protein n=1 Tax=Arthrobacter sp. ISL-28 TaxID=2819108 RepID=UPI001BECCA44|nr:glutamine synthetase family protein [Arthrobacter sp. ISL-28]MBT2523700.1 glutamine synthetase [Arthrobacter sp. ISL-28]
MTGIRSVRIGFVDQHGLVRSKTLSSAGLASAFANGITAASTLLSKDTSGHTVFSAFDADGGLGAAEMAGAADIIMIPDPTTFRVLDWADDEGWMLSDLKFKNGAEVPFCSRTVFANALQRAESLGMLFMTGLEIEFHLFKRSDITAGPLTVNQLNVGNQLLLESWADEVQPFMRRVQDHLARLEIRLSTIEVEYGPSQLEITLSPGIGIGPADSVILLRTAMKQVARRHGYHVTFMCRPQLPNSVSSGWHLHQCLIGTGKKSGQNLFLPPDGETTLSETGKSFTAGLLRHGRAASAFAVPTINGYKRFQPYSMAPDRVAWASDNRGAIVRVVGSPESGNTHIENRIGEPAANPYLYMASQLHAGLQGINERLLLGPSADNPYTDEAQKFPATLSEAIRALEADTTLTRAMGEDFVRYYIGLKRAEIVRFNHTVTDWEQNEYFDLF